jgi:EpsI family protein
MKAKLVNILGVEDYLMRSYTNPSGGNLLVYVGYYETQSEGDIIHSPKHCLPGAGWQPVYAGTEILKLDTGSRDPVEINKYVVQKGTERELIFYWYHSRGRVVASEYADKLYLIWDSILKKRSDGALIRFSSRIYPDESRTQAHMLSFIQQFFPVLQEYLPGANNNTSPNLSKILGLRKSQD